MGDLASGSGGWAGVPCGGQGLGKALAPGWARWAGLELGRAGRRERGLWAARVAGLFSISSFDYCSSFSISSLLYFPTINFIYNE
jgi:hypothetical protein